MALTLLTLNSQIVSSHLKKAAKTKSIYDDAEFGDEINAMWGAYDLNEYAGGKQKHTNLFSKVYEKVDEMDISQNVGNLMKENEIGNKSFRKLNAIASLEGGAAKLKDNGMVKSTLKLILNDPKKKPKTRVNAAKLAARITDLPVSFQITETDTKKAPKDLNTYIVVPRIKRLFRPDYYVENYKAGNWEP